MSLLTIHDVLIFLGSFCVTTNDKVAVAEMVAAFNGPLVVPSLATASSFRVTCSRAGRQTYSSHDVGRLCGEALHERYGVDGDMSNYEVNVRVDILGKLVMVGRQLNRSPLSRRHKDGFVNIVATRSNIALCMLELAGVKPGDTLLDPFCGGGTILLEAASKFGGNIVGFGSDAAIKAVEGSTGNAAERGYSCKGTTVSAQRCASCFDIMWLLCQNDAI